MESSGLQQKPENIWNCNETGKSFEHNPVRVVAEVGCKIVVGRTSADRTNTTIMACVNATGDKMPPIMIVNGKTAIQQRHLKTQFGIFNKTVG